VGNGGVNPSKKFPNFGQKTDEKSQLTEMRVVPLGRQALKQDGPSAEEARYRFREPFVLIHFRELFFFEKSEFCCN
jgi:hypothetical protein